MSNADTSDSDWYRRTARWLGKQVRAVTAEDNPQAVVEGEFLGFGDGGDFQVLCDDGFVYHCWPLLHITERTQLGRQEGEG